DDVSFPVEARLAPQWGQSFRLTRARSSRHPARPYIDRLIVFSRFTWPSTGPLLHDSVNAAATAASSSRRPFAKVFNSLTPDSSAFANQSDSGRPTSLRIIPTNSDATSHAIARPGTLARSRSDNLGPTVCSVVPSSGFGFGRQTNSNDSF